MNDTYLFKNQKKNYYSFVSEDCAENIEDKSNANANTKNKKKTNKENDSNSKFQIYFIIWNYCISPIYLSQIVCNCLS